MGKEIISDQFTPDDYLQFRKRLEQETATLGQHVKQGKLDDQSWCFGFELEGWITDANYPPSSRITDLVEAVEGDQLVPELAAFNFELNGDPVSLQPDLMSRFAANLQNSWSKAQHAAEKLDLHLLMIGVLPTLQEDDFVIANMSPMQRYQALNRQVFAMRGDHPVQIDIKGQDRLKLSFDHVMLESAATSLQLHLQAPISHAVRVFNLSKMLSGPMVAVSANSPGLFGKRLWDETRIPIFEQSIDVGASDLTRRVTFGVRYLQDSIMEAFEANLNRYPIMLPQLMEEDLDELPHLQLHNGTIWRWNRPLLGWVQGKPHIRIEHRVMPSGPSVPDILANASLFFGCVLALLDEPKLEQRLPFETARDNFYLAAQHSLAAEIEWFDGKKRKAPDLLLELCDLAESGFEQFGIQDATPWIQRMRQRITSGENGCALQQRLVQKHGSVQAMLAAYEKQQNV